MANPYYDHTTYPAQGASGSSSALRSELDAVEAGFDKLPTLSGNGSKAVVVNSGGTALGVTTGTLALAGNFATAGAYAVTLTATASTGVTLPTTGTLATLAGTETLTNKTLTSPTLTTPALGTPASGTLTNCTGTAAGLTAGNVTTNANLTGPITSTGNATAVAAQTGTGSTFVMQASPTLTTPTINSAAAVGGAWTAASTWTIPAVTLGGTVSGGGNQINNVIIGTSTPLAGSFTTFSAGSGTFTGLSNTPLSLYGTGVYMDIPWGRSAGVSEARLFTSNSASQWFTSSSAGDSGIQSITGRCLIGTVADSDVRIMRNNAIAATVSSTGLAVTGTLSATSSIGYATGAGGTVTQITSRTTGVTLDKVCGAITLVSAAGTATWQSFTVTNSTVAATDTIIVNQKSGTDLNMIHVTAVAAGSFRISFATTGGTTTEQPVFNFTVLKGVAA